MVNRRPGPRNSQTKTWLPTGQTKTWPRHQERRSSPVHPIRQRRR